MLQVWANEQVNRIVNWGQQPSEMPSLEGTGTIGDIKQAAAGLLQTWQSIMTTAKEAAQNAVGDTSPQTQGVQPASTTGGGFLTNPYALLGLGAGGVATLLAARGGGDTAATGQTSSTTSPTTPSNPTNPPSNPNPAPNPTPTPNPPTPNDPLAALNGTTWTVTSSQTNGPAACFFAPSEGLGGLHLTVQGNSLGITFRGPSGTTIIVNGGIKPNGEFLATATGVPLFAFVATLNSQGNFPVSPGQNTAQVTTQFNWTAAPPLSQHCVGQSTTVVAGYTRTG